MMFKISNYGKYCDLVKLSCEYFGDPAPMDNICWHCSYHQKDDYIMESDEFICQTCFTYYRYQFLSDATYELMSPDINIFFIRILSMMT